MTLVAMPARRVSGRRDSHLLRIATAGRLSEKNAYSTQIRHVLFEIVALGGACRARDDVQRARSEGWDWIGPWSVASGRAPVWPHSASPVKAGR